MYIPQNVLQATFADLSVVGRQEVIQKVGQFLQSYDETGKEKASIYMESLGSEKHLFWQRLRSS